MTEIPISSDVINVESCNKDFLEAGSFLWHIIVSCLIYSKFKGYVI